MSILNGWSNILLIGGIGLVLIVLWVFSILSVYGSATSRQLTSGERFFWVAIAAAFPLVGALVYLFARLAGLITRPAGSAPVVYPEHTEIQYLDQPGPVVPQDHGSWSEPHPVAMPGRWQLFVREGPYTGSKFPFSRLPVKIGRGVEAEIRLEDDTRVSRQHAELFGRGGEIYLRDLGSLHGTSVNNQPVREQRLAPGDTIKVGDSVLLFERLG